MPGENNSILVQFKLKPDDITQDTVDVFRKFADTLEDFIGKAATDALKKALGEKFTIPISVEEKSDETTDDTEGERKPVNTNRKKANEGGEPPENTGEEEVDDASKDGSKDGKKKGFLANVKDAAKDPETLLRITQKGIHASANMLNTGIKKGFGIVEDIYSRLKSASPLLQAIESMFNLAMQLFFMPLGNKLAEVLIPAVLELVDDVVAIWDSFEGKTLGDMFATAIKEGTSLLGGFFNDIGDKLIEQGGMVGQIGRLLESIGNFIENNGAQVLSSILSVVTTLLGNIKHFISLWVSLKMTEIAMQATGIWGDLTGTKALIALGAVLTVGGASFAASEVGLSAMGLAEGGYVPAKPGGQLAVISEGGEGEYVVPESKKEAFIKYHGAQIIDTAYRESNEGTRYVESPSTPVEDEPTFYKETGQNVYHEDEEQPMPRRSYEPFIIESPHDSPQVNVNVKTIDTSAYGESYRPNTLEEVPTTVQESRVQNVNITYHINGYTDSELRTIIRETVDEQVAKAVYRS